MQPAGAQGLSSRHLPFYRFHRGPTSVVTKGSDRPFVRASLKVAAVLPGISHCLVTQALAHQSLNPIIISQLRVLRVNAENIPHWQLLDLSLLL